MFLVMRFRRPRDRIDQIERSELVFRRCLLVLTVQDGDECRVTTRGGVTNEFDRGTRDRLDRRGRQLVLGHDRLDLPLERLERRRRHAEWLLLWEKKGKRQKTRRFVMLKFNCY